MRRMIFISLTMISGIAWTLVYLLIIYRGRKDKRCGMPFFALAYNLSWELTNSLLIGGDWNLQRSINTIWLVFDILILMTYVKYERRRVPKRYEKLFLPWVVISIFSAFSIILAANREFEGYLGAQYSAFIQNLMMSILFIQMLIRRDSVGGQSLSMAIAKMIGTLSPTIMVFMANTSRLLQVVGVSILIFDLIYIYLLYVKYAELKMDRKTRDVRQKALLEQ